MMMPFLGRLVLIGRPLFEKKQLWPRQRSDSSDGGPTFFMHFCTMTREEFEDMKVQLHVVCRMLTEIQNDTSISYIMMFLIRKTIIFVP